MRCRCRMISLAVLALFCLALPMPSRAFSSRLTETRGPSLSSSLESKEDESKISPALQPLQTHAAAVVSPFRPRPFRPLPGPWQNPHVQTILGYFLRDTPAARMDSGLSDWEIGRLVAGLLLTKLFSSDAPSRATDFWDARKRIETPDGDWFHADLKYAQADDPASSKRDFPTVMLLHGLQSNSYSTASVGLAQAASASDRNVVCLNFRGCSGAPNDTLGAYHLGFTDDLKHFLNVWCQDDNDSSDTSTPRQQQPIYLMGFSLGANAVLKCLGELQESAVTEYGIQGAAVLSAPLEQTKNSHVLAQPGGIHRYVYTHNLLQSLQQVARQKWQRHCENNNPSETTTRLSRQDYERALAAQTITEYDDAFIAPIYGFADCWDYYEKTSSLYFLDKIAVPTLVLNAADDPFFDKTVWPSDQHKHIQWHRTEHGGHLGYVLHQCDNHDDKGWWAASELARFLDHVQDFPTTTEE